MSLAVMLKYYMVLSSSSSTHTGSILDKITALSPSITGSLLFPQLLHSLVFYHQLSHWWESNLDAREYQMVSLTILSIWHCLEWCLHAHAFLLWAVLKHWLKFVWVAWQGNWWWLVDDGWKWHWQGALLIRSHLLLFLGFLWLKNSNDC